MRENPTAETRKASPHVQTASSEAATTWPRSRIWWITWAIGMGLMNGDLFLPAYWQLPTVLAGIVVIVLLFVAGLIAFYREVEPN